MQRQAMAACLFGRFKTQEAVEDGAQLLKVVGGTMVSTLVDVVAVVVVIPALGTASGEELFAERLVAAAEHASADEIAYKVEPGELEAAKAGLTSPPDSEQVPEEVGHVGSAR